MIVKKKKELRRRDEKMTVENKNLKDEKSVGKWKLNYFAQFFCSVTFTNCKSTDKKMITMILFP